MVGGKPALLAIQLNLSLNNNLF